MSRAVTTAVSSAFASSLTPAWRSTCVHQCLPAVATVASKPASHIAMRYSSHSPLGSAPPTRKKVTLPTLQAMHRRQEPITMITAHDFPSAHVADHAGMDMVLVGDSLAMVALGMEDTSEVIMEEMILHCRSVARGAKSAFIVCITRFYPFVTWLRLIHSAGRRPPNGHL